MNKNISLMITDGTNDNVYYKLSNVFYGKIKGTYKLLKRIPRVMTMPQKSMCIFNF